MGGKGGGGGNDDAKWYALGYARDPATGGWTTQIELNARNAPKATATPTVSAGPEALSAPAPRAAAAAPNPPPQGSAGAPQPDALGPSTNSGGAITGPSAAGNTAKGATGGTTGDALGGAVLAPPKYWVGGINQYSTPSQSTGRTQGSMKTSSQT